jgi:FMN reductase [NAD(P)H]
MNETLQLTQSHCSERSYKTDPIPDEILDQIIESAHLAPTSKNSQQVSIIVVKDAASRARIAEIAGGQAWIAQAPVFLLFVADLYKTCVGLEKVGVTQQTQHSMEGVFCAATDVGIALGTAILAARSYGLGTVPIGGIRRDPQAMIELLGLPQYTFPVNGLVIGYVDEPAVQKPRLPVASFRHEERYHAESLGPAIEAYEITLPEYWKKIHRADGSTWTKNLAASYGKVYYPKVKAAAVAQGFTCED